MTRILHFLYVIFLLSIFVSTINASEQAVQGVESSTGGTTMLSIDLNSTCNSDTKRPVQGSINLCTDSNAKAFDMLLPPPCPNQEAILQGSSMCTPAAIIINGLSDFTKKEYYAPFVLEPSISYSGTDKLYYYVESNNTDLMEVTVDENGLISINATYKSGGIGQAQILFIVFTVDEVASYHLNITIDINDFPPFNPLAFERVSEDAWDDTAVRKVLHTFAFGGHASDIQIETWANMPCEYAIVQILNFNPNNTLLSPSTSILPATNSIEDLTNFWSSNSSDNFIDESKRYHFKRDYWGALPYSWNMAVMAHGLNPFVHRVGLWETNYHMSVNHNAGVHAYPLFHHYDNIINALTQNSTYANVIAQGAKNAAVAFQYGHNYNIYNDGIYRVNEDFAREYHQLFLGILGEYDPSYHEATTIPNTAKALTDMYARWHSEENGGPDTEIVFGTEYHSPSDLEILNTTISGADASFKIDAIALVGIEHSESKKNLPVMIIEHFADNNLSDATKTRIRDSWASMSQPSLLPFLWAYALSTDFHSELRFKYLTSIERTMGVFNKMVIDNEDNRYQLYDPTSMLRQEGVEVFSPIHDVFGHQTALEASDNSNIFRVNYNNSVAQSYFYTRTYSCLKDDDNKCVRDDNDEKISIWEKDWAKKIPTNDNGKFVVEDVALWLWNYFIADGGKNYGVLERAHIIALLNGKDLALFINKDDPLKVYSLEDLLEDDALIRLINDGSVAQMYLDSSVLDERREANLNIGLAIAFIVATPYIFVQEGR